MVCVVSSVSREVCRVRCVVRRVGRVSETLVLYRLVLVHTTYFCYTFERLHHTIGRGTRRRANSTLSTHSPLPSGLSVAALSIKIQVSSIQLYWNNVAIT